MKKAKLTAFLSAVIILSGCNSAPAGDITETNGTTTDAVPVITEKEVESVETTATSDEKDENGEANTESSETIVNTEQEISETSAPEYDYDAALAAEEVTRLNGIAEEVAIATNSFLEEAKAGGYGMIDGAEGTFVYAYIDDGIWLLFLDNVDCFECADEFVQWWGCGEADKDSEYKFIEDNDSRFALRLAQALPDVKNASVGAWIENGECKAVYFTESTTAGDYQLDIFFREGGWAANTCEWDGYNQGVSEEGNFVGTYPVLGIG